jgi:toxin-antitoxin system PIN domain toxin
MSACLLDVNVLVALAWPNHVHHAPAKEWFAAHHAAGWATCSVTESGFVRVSSNSRATPEAKSPAEALFLLRQMVAQTGHQFWLDDISIAKSELIDAAKLLGHRQVTDAHLVALTIHHGGRLVSFDRGLLDVVPAGTRAHEVLTILG